MNAPRVTDNDRDEITVTLHGKEIRGWSYANETERRTKMLAAREFCEGWFQATERTPAPDLLAALKTARQTIIDLTNARWSEAEGTAEEWVAGIDAAIAKAEGR